MSATNTLVPRFFSDLENKRLSSTIAALSRHPNNMGIKAVLFDALLESTLLLVTGNKARRPSNAPLMIGSDGLANYELGTQITMVLLTDERGKSLMPVFTDGAALKRLGLDNELFALAVPALQAIEMFLVSEASVFCINPGLAERVDIDQDTLRSLAEQLRIDGIIPEQRLVEKTRAV